MVDNQNIKLKSQIARFKKKMYKEHGVELYIMKPLDTDHRCTLEKYKQLTLKCIVEDHPKYKKYNFKTKSRERDFIIYLQAMSFIAHNDGYSLTGIALSIHRTHATIINSCNVIKNGIYTRDKKILSVISKINNKIDNYVGTVSKNVDRKIESKPVPNTIWDEARRFINS